MRHLSWKVRPLPEPTLSAAGHWGKRYLWKLHCALVHGPTMGFLALRHLLLKVRPSPEPTPLCLGDWGRRELGEELKKEEKILHLASLLLPTWVLALCHLMLRVRPLPEPTLGATGHWGKR